MQTTTGLREVGTFLTDSQLREAEAVFSRLEQLRQQREEEQRRLVAHAARAASPDANDAASPATHHAETHVPPPGRQASCADAK